MSLMDDLQAQLTDIQAKIAILQGAPEDTYNFGTIALFAFSNNSKIYYKKVEEEAWRPMQGNSNIEKTLAEWVYTNRIASPSLYFEVYLMSPQAVPIYASA